MKHLQRLIKLQETTQHKNESTHQHPEVRNPEGGRNGDVLEIQAQSADDVLVGAQALVNQVCVVDDVSAENESANDRVDEVHRLTEREDNLHEASDTC